MKNAKPSQCKRSIVMPLEEFRGLVYALCGSDNVDVEFDGRRLLVSDANGNRNTVYKALNRYFDIQIDSLHVDTDNDHLDVWIAYQNVFNVSE